MSEQLLRRLHTKYGKVPHCHLCRRYIVAGDWFISKNRRRGTVRYHRDCARKLKIIM